MYVLVIEGEATGYPISVLDNEGIFDELEDAIAMRDHCRRVKGNPDICVYLLVKTPEEQPEEQLATEVVK